MPDAITLLEQDHREVEQLFAQYEESNDAEVLAQICDELAIHTQIEEQIFYPAVAKLDGMRDLVEEGRREHAEVKDAIAAIEAASYEGNITRHVETVMGGVNHHVQEEEAEMFPKVRTKMETAQLASLGEEMDALKQELLHDITVGSAGTPAAADTTRDELYEIAKEQDIAGRSAMKKDELARAVRQSR